MLLYLLIEGGNKIISSVTEVCKGPEELASFILQRLINHPTEELRCSGIRLLTHFYLRIDNLPVTLLSMTIPRRGGNVISRAMMPPKAHLRVLEHR
jgi:4-hydroxyphenylpyruvate dioxygenase-like putative hemolysin